MNEKVITISEADYEKAKAAVIQEMLDDERLTGVAKLLMPLTGIVVIAKMETRLFGDKEEVQ